MTAAELTGPLAALTAGVVTSLHCVGMCGPLACAVCVRGGSGGGACNKALFNYHAARILSYTLCGALAGLLGRALAPYFSGWTSHLMVWGFALIFAAVALGLDQRLAVPGLLQSKFSGLFRVFASWAVPWRGGALGLASPLLPCGPLYLVIGVAAVSGSIPGGALLLAAFAVGTIPLAWLAQLQWFRLQNRWSPLAMDRGRRVLAAVAALLLVGRAMSGTDLDMPVCPFCK